MKDLETLIIIGSVGFAAWWAYQNYINNQAAATTAAQNAANPTQADDGTEILNDLSNLVGGGL